MPPEFGLDASIEIDILCCALCHGKAQRRLVIPCRRKALPGTAADASFPARPHINGSAGPTEGLGPQGRSAHCRAEHGWLLPTTAVRNAGVTPMCLGILRVLLLGARKCKPKPLTAPLSSGFSSLLPSSSSYHCSPVAMKTQAFSTQQGTDNE